MKKANKALSPEEMQGISNIKSILDEIIAMNDGVADAEVQMSEEMSEEKMENKPECDGNEKEVEKGIETTSTDVATASDDAEDRIDETQSEVNEENVNEVAKALMMLFDKKVKKSEKKSNPLVDALTQVATVQKSMQEQVNDLSETLYHIIDAKGIVDQIKVAKSKNEKTQPIVSSDNDALMNFIKKSLAGETPQKEVRKSNSSIARDNIAKRDVLAGILGK